MSKKICRLEEIASRTPMVLRSQCSLNPGQNMMKKETRNKGTTYDIRTFTASNAATGDADTKEDKEIKIHIPVEWNNTNSHLRALCKVCQVNDLGVAFRPCGHVLCCQKCAMGFVKCPICGKDIRTRGQIFVP